MYGTYPNPWLEAELAWRRELLLADRARRSRRGPWFGRRRRSVG